MHSFDASEIFKVLGVETRLKIIELLKNYGSMGAKKIAEECGLSISAISQHLRILKNSGIIESKRHGYHIPYFINEESMEKCRSILDNVCSCKCSPHHHKNGLTNKSIHELKEIEKKLKNELERVKAMIKEIEK